MNEFQEKIGVGQRQNRYGKHAGTSQDVPVWREDGKLSGKHTNHWDGRVDATIIAPTIHRNLSTGETTTT